MKSRTTHSAPKTHSGFTLVELMVAISIAAILMGITIPSFRSFLQNSRLTTPANDLLHGLQFARTEAIKNQKNVVICASDNPDDQSATCSYGAFTGWIIFEDSDKSWQREPNEPIIRAHTTVDKGVTVKSDNNGIVVYDSNGFSALPGAGGLTATQNITICDSRGNTMVGSGGTADSVARAIFIAGSNSAAVRGLGRARESKLYADVVSAGGC